MQKSENMQMHRFIELGRSNGKVNLGLNSVMSCCARPVASFWEASLKDATLRHLEKWLLVDGCHCFDRPAIPDREASQLFGTLVLSALPLSTGKTP